MPSTSDAFVRYMLKARKAAIRSLDSNERELMKIYKRLIIEVEDELAHANPGAGRLNLNRVLTAMRRAAGDTTVDVKSLLDHALLESADMQRAYTEAALSHYEKVAERTGLHFDPQRMLFRVPEEAVKIIYSRTYNDGLVLSDRIWKLGDRTQKGLARIVQDGVARGLHYDDPRITEQVKRFLQPARRGVKVKPTVTRVLKDIDPKTGKPIEYTFRQRPASFDAARLLRTEHMNAFKEAGHQCALRNPACYGERWTLSSFHPDIGCDCEDYAQHDEGLGEGVFSIGNFPITPHPHCICGHEQVVVSVNEFMDWIDNFKAGQDNRIADWWNEYGYQLAA